MRILALDLGKFNSVACVYQRETGEHRFQRFRTSPAEVHDLVVGAEPDLVVFEACGLAGWVHDVVTALAIESLVANVNHEAWRWKNVKRKTDRDDALKLARLAAMGQLKQVYVPRKGMREWRSLVAYRHTLVGRQTAIRNNIRAVLLRQGLTMPSGHRAWTKAGIEQLTQETGALDGLEMEELWRGIVATELEALKQVGALLADVERKLDRMSKADERVELLRTAGGVGPRLSEALVTTIDDPHRFRNGRQVSCYVGLTPRQYESGTMRRAGRISREGPALLRGLLVEIAWIVKRHSPWAQTVFDQVCRGQRSRRKQAIVAVARRLLVRLWAMLRDGTEWRESAASAAA